MYQQVGKIAYKPDLDTALAFDDYFDAPHRRFKTIHVAGTNGKGSVSHMLASVLQSAGYRVGLFTSPHLRDFRERIKVDGVMISEKEVVDFVVKHKEKIEELKPSFFEMTATMAFDHFARKRVSVAVIETGMGGRLDATNVITPVISVITNIGFDHVEHLGDTLPLIAAEKAGIMKPGVPVVIGDYHPETAPVFEEKAATLKSPVCYAEQHFRVLDATTDVQQHITMTASGNLFPFTVDVDLLGDYQRKNVPVVFSVLDLLRQPPGNGKSRRFYIPDDAVRKGLANVTTQTGLRGRWEIISKQPLIICDTGHNVHGFTQSMRQLQAISCRRLHFIFGVVNDKDVASLLPLMPPDAYYYFTKADLPRAMDAHELAKRCMDYGLRGQIVQTVPNALKIARGNAFPEDVIFVGGSTFVVAEILP